MVNALIRAGLVVTASWPIHTEMKSRFRATASAALASRPAQSAQPGLISQGTTNQTRLV